MILKPIFPTVLHQDTAELVRDYFLKIPNVDTVLVVNSCARGQAVPESDLDFAILVTPDTTPTEIRKIETDWQIYSEVQRAFEKYKQSNQFAHLHLDIIDGKYTPTILEIGAASDFFEVEIGNQICYSAPMDKAGLYFQELQNKWLPYYNEDLRLQRLTMTRNACKYDLNHIPLFIKRGLHFQAFDILCKAFQEYLQTLFIANRTYPIAYNKWIKEQVVKWLNKPDLYPKLSPILSVSNIESNEVNDKANMLGELLENLPNE
ncbi:MAG: nucleotidyltransferase domain-containing protein [Bacteroidetes bacterium]|nr:nucleotidyltransferase domain-containing protein [Bacteroidota bacterium]